MNTARERSMQPVCDYLESMGLKNLDDYSKLPNYFSIEALLTEEQTRKVKTHPSVEDMMEDFTEDDFE